MKKLIIIIFAATLSLGAFAQNETMFIHKGGQIISQYAVADIDSITFFHVPRPPQPLAPTLYFAVRGGNIMAIQLTENLLSDPDYVITPIDLGVSSGATPMNILFHNDLLYILDAGQHFTFQDDSEFHNLGDGGIRVMSRDGSRVESMMRNIGHAFNDPFDGFIEEDFLYFTNRNTGIIRLPLSTRNETWTFRLHDNGIPWLIRNTMPPMFWNLTYGAMNTGFLKVNGVWWWAKRWNQPGIFRFTESDIRTSATPFISPVGIMQGFNMRSFTWDSQREVMYFTVYNPGFEGLYRATIVQMEAITAPAQLAPFRLTTAEGRSVVPIIPLSFNEATEEGTVGEPLAITQLALNKATGCVYFGLRSANPEEVPSGLYRFNPVTNFIEPVILGINVLGVAINNTPTRLF